MENRQVNAGNSRLLWIVGAIALVVIAAFVLIWTQTDLFNPSDTPDTEDTSTFHLTVTVDALEIIHDADLTCAKGTTLINAMSAGVTDNGGVVFDNSDYGAYITSICGYTQDPDTGKYWSYTINGEYAMVGASDYIPADGDAVVFDLSAMAW